MNTYILEETSRGVQPVSIDARMFKDRKIFMTEPVTNETASELIKQLMYLDSEAPGEEIEIYISSPGGEVTAGLVICDFLSHMKSPVTTICIGIAASMGAILFMHGDKRRMLPHSKIMIHDPSFGSLDVGGQKPMQLMEQVDSLMKVREELARIISEKTGMKIEEVYEKTKNDTFFTAKEAVKAGIATEVLYG